MNQGRKYWEKKRPDSTYLRCSLKKEESVFICNFAKCCLTSDSFQQSDVTFFVPALLSASFLSYTRIQNTSVKKPISTFEYFSRFLARGNKLPDSIDEDFSQDFLLSKSWCNEVRKKRWINERIRRSKRSTKRILSSCSWSHRSFQVNYHSISLPLTLKERIYLSSQIPINGPISSLFQRRGSKKSSPFNFQRFILTLNVCLLVCKSSFFP